MAVRVGINGFGRIGRLVQGGLGNPDIEVVAANDLADVETNAHLLKYDSTHGRLNRSVEVKEGALYVDGKELKVFAEKDPAKLPWGDLGVDVVVESTGVFRDREGAGKHITAGAKKVITAPAKGENITIVLGVNEDKYDPKAHHIVSNASCTTAACPGGKGARRCLHDQARHDDDRPPFTNDQRILDLVHKDLRRARSRAVDHPDSRPERQRLSHSFCHT